MSTKDLRIEATCAWRKSPSTSAGAGLAGSATGATGAGVAVAFVADSRQTLPQVGPQPLLQLLLDQLP